jgi:hypothetical protein
MFRIPHCLDIRLTDGGKVVSPTHRPRSNPQKQYFSASSIHICQGLSEPQSLVQLKVLGKLKKLIHLIWFRTRDLQACSIVSQPLRYRVPRINQWSL